MAGAPSLRVFFVATRFRWPEASVTNCPGSLGVENFSESLTGPFRANREALQAAKKRISNSAYAFRDGPSIHRNGEDRLRPRYNIATNQKLVFDFLIDQDGYPTG